LLSIIFGENTTHPLAWYNDVTSKTDSSAGLYRYDLKTTALTLVIPLHSLGVATPYNTQPGLPLLLSVHYSSEQLFYQLIVHPFEQQSQFIIYRHSVAHPEMPNFVWG
jgi:hypothetical protein